jgi:hypothetical protein
MTWGSGAPPLAEVGGDTSPGTLVPLRGGVRLRGRAPGSGSGVEGRTPELGRIEGGGIKKPAPHLGGKGELAGST